MMRRAAIILMSATALVAAADIPFAPENIPAPDGNPWHFEMPEALLPIPAPEPPSLRLTDTDFEEVARELDIDPATIHAVVDIEAGRAHSGFNADSTVVINFDLSMFRSMAKRNKVNLSKYTKRYPEVFARPNIRKYGNQQRAQHARLRQAMEIDSLTAIQGTFWGMFQIGGFNWKKCGAKSPADFVERMSRSERDQLELFANFLRSTGLDRHLRSHNWAAFARGYNGPSYARRGYHTRLARAYAKYK